MPNKPQRAEARYRPAVFREEPQPGATVRGAAKRTSALTGTGGVQQRRKALADHPALDGTEVDPQHVLVALVGPQREARRADGGLGRKAATRCQPRSVGRISPLSSVISSHRGAPSRWRRRSRPPPCCVRSSPSFVVWKPRVATLRSRGPCGRMAVRTPDRRAIGRHTLPHPVTRASPCRPQGRGWQSARSSRSRLAADHPAARRETTNGRPTETSRRSVAFCAGEVGFGSASHGDIR
jgi:hypothetical protein